MARIFTKEQREFYLANFKMKNCKEITKLMNDTFGLNIKESQIKSYNANNKLNSGLTGRFEKGRTPFNKGKRGYTTPGSEKGWFKEGHIPENHKPVGSERLTKDGYTMVKVAEPRKWKLKQHVIYESHFGKIPKGYKIVFADTNTSNFNIENLLLVKDGELLIMNNHKLIAPKRELTKAGHSIAKLKMKIAERNANGKD